MDLSTTYLGLKLRTPLVCAASPLSQEIDNLKRMEDAGAVRRRAPFAVRGAIAPGPRRTRSDNLERGTFSSPEALNYFPEPEEFRLGPQEYLEHIARARQAVSIPIIASLNACSAGGWTNYARDNRAGRRRRPRVEHLLHSHGRGTHRPPTSRRGTCEIVRERESRNWHSRGRQVKPVLHQLLEHGARVLTRPAPTDWCCLTGFTSRTLTSKPSRSRPNILLEHAHGHAAAIALDRHSLRPRRGQPGGHQRRAPRRRMS